MIEMNQIILADCMDIMKDIPDKYFELAIVDPPYSELCNLHGGSSSDAKNGWGVKWMGNKHHEWNVKPSAKYFKELFRVSKNQIIWGGNYFIENLFNTSCLIIWDKGQRDFSLADGEMAWSSFNKPLRIFSYSRAENNKTDRFHPTQKPVALYKWLLKNYAKEGDKILDTHSGSGTTAIACVDMGFKYLCIEKDKEYFEKSVERVNKELIKIKLF